MATFRCKENEETPQQGTPKFAGDRTAAETDRERVEQRAYELYLERGGGEGRTWTTGSALSGSWRAAPELRRITR